MTTMPTFRPSGSMRVDRIVRGLVGVFETTLPDRIRSLYLFGSHSAGNAHGTSDIDLGIVFKGMYHTQDELNTATELCKHCRSLSPLPLDIWVLSEQQLAEAHHIGNILQLQSSAMVLYGEDIRKQLPDLSHDMCVCWAVHVPPYGMSRLRQNSPLLRVPLDFPEPDRSFYGYDQLLMPTTDGLEVPSTKLLVSIVMRIASALIALRTNELVFNKAQCVQRYHATINDEWSSLIEQVYLCCRDRWGYLLPESAVEQAQLRHLCEQTLAFENYFLQVYKGVLLDELQHPQTELRLHAAQRLSQVVFPSDDVYTALHTLTRDADVRLRHLAHHALGMMAGAGRMGKAA